MNAPAVFGSQTLLTFTQFKLSALRIIQLVLKSQRAGLSCLPHGLGLSERNYRYLKNLALDSDILLLLKQQNHNEDVRQQLLEMRQDEWQEVRRLLLLNRAGYSDYEEDVSLAASRLEQISIVSGSEDRQVMMPPLKLPQSL